jgi:hypothetical protein
MIATNLRENVEHQILIFAEAACNSRSMAFGEISVENI